MIGAVIIGKEDAVDGLHKLKSTCRCAELVAYNLNLIVSLGKLKHGLNEVMSVTVEPCGPEDEISVAEMFYHVLRSRLGYAVYTLWIRLVILHIGSLLGAVKDIIG